MRPFVGNRCSDCTRNPLTGKDLSVHQKPREPEVRSGQQTSTPQRWPPPCCAGGAKLEKVLATGCLRSDVRPPVAWRCANLLCLSERYEDRDYPRLRQVAVEEKRSLNGDSAKKKYVEGTICV
jgi:hypothetical protein